MEPWFFCLGFRENGVEKFGSFGPLCALFLLDFEDRCVGQWEN